MRFPRIRFTIGTLMIAIAVSGIMLGVGIVAGNLKSRSAYYTSRATEYATKETLFAKHVTNLEKTVAASKRAEEEYSEEIKGQSGLVRILLTPGRAMFHAQAVNFNKKVDKYNLLVRYYSTMKIKYQTAACRPWMSVPSDLPEPLDE